MKRIFFFFLILLFLPVFPTRAQEYGTVERQVYLAQQWYHRSLSFVVRRDLQRYYHSLGFPTSFLYTGWKRVNLFIQWIDAHADELEKEEIHLEGRTVALSNLYTKPEFLHDTQAQKMFWIYLGARYITDIYQVKADFSKLAIYDCKQLNCSVGGTGLMFVSTQENISIPALINLGIHETTHLLPFLTEEKNDLLSELAAFYSQYNYGLPVRAEEAVDLADGIRDVRLVYQQRPDFNIALEYNYFVAGIFLNPHIQPAEIFSFTNNEGNITVLETCLNLIAAQNNRFFVRKPEAFSEKFKLQDVKNFQAKLKFIDQDIIHWQSQSGEPFYLGKFPKKDTPFYAAKNLDEQIYIFVRAVGDEIIFQTGYEPLNEKQYLKYLFGNSAAQTETFYKQLTANLPPELIAEVKQVTPVQTPFTFLFSCKRRFLADLSRRYKKPVEQAIIKALKEVNAPPVPPVPEGYM